MPVSARLLGAPPTVCTRLPLVGWAGPPPARTHTRPSQRAQGPRSRASRRSPTLGSASAARGVVDPGPQPPEARSMEQGAEVRDQLGTWRATALGNPSDSQPRGSGQRGQSPKLKSWPELASQALESDLTGVWKGTSCLYCARKWFAATTSQPSQFDESSAQCDGALVECLRAR